MKKPYKFLVGCVLVLTTAGCNKEKIDGVSSIAKASIHSTCISVINFESNKHTDVFQDEDYNIDPSSGATIITRFTVGGYSPNQADELGINFYGRPVVGVYDLASSSPFQVNVYWDPDNDTVNEYGSESGEVEVTKIEWYGDFRVKEIEVELRNVVAKTPGGDQLCINNGIIHIVP